MFTEISAELELEGKLREFVRKIQELRKESGLSVSDIVGVVYESNDQNKAIVDKYADEIKKKVSANSLIAGDTFSIKR
ncbi:hypothetical protein A2619_03170 [candidate division WWE3 bacterium RIFOXYD1_FULL_39_9]|uniref:Uncharacterized protein n=1 Tax=candidate division WWE3 bacterium RIFOXYD1_FULL_39_9 TaxID=1802649 RepID=A0A1F4X8P2_UNCKA|nr:MAG: hypothetical protein A2619_03170 [candidate division WWE3 bacterium RIFOXYD1_FULL_39_9]